MKVSSVAIVFLGALVCMSLAGFLDEGTDAGTEVAKADALGRMLGGVHDHIDHDDHDNEEHDDNHDDDDHDDDDHDDNHDDDHDNDHDDDHNDDHKDDHNDDHDDDHDDEDHDDDHHDHDHDHHDHDNEEAAYKPYPWELGDMSNVETAGSPEIVEIDASTPALPNESITLSAVCNAAAGTASTIRMAGIGGNFGNQAFNSVFSSGDITGSIDRISHITFNAMSPAELRANYDVLLFTWDTDASLNGDWKTRIEPYIALGGSVFWEDDSNIPDLAPEVDGSVYNGSPASYDISYQSPPNDVLTANGVSGSFVNHHLRLNTVDPSWTVYISVGSIALASFKTFPSRGRMIVQGPDQDYHALRASGNPSGNQYQFILNQLKWLTLSQGITMTWYSPGGTLLGEGALLELPAGYDEGTYRAVCTQGGGLSDEATVFVELPSNVPSSMPSNVPSSAPSGSPSQMPLVVPSDIPSNSPSSKPSNVPSSVPSGSPTKENCADIIYRCPNKNKNGGSRDKKSSKGGAGYKVPICIRDASKAGEKNEYRTKCVDPFIGPGKGFKEDEDKFTCGCCAEELLSWSGSLLSSQKGDGTRSPLSSRTGKGSGKKLHPIWCKVPYDAGM